MNLENFTLIGKIGGCTQGILSAGTSLIANKDINILGKAVTIDNTVNTVDSLTKYEFKQSGLTVSLGGGIAATGINAYNNIQRSSEVQDDRLKALYDYRAAGNLKNIKDQLNSGLTRANLTKGVNISVSIGSSQTTSEQSVHTETVNTSNITAGNDVNIIARDGDINLKGTKIDAANVALDAAQNINIDAAQNKQQTTSTSGSSSWSVGGTIGVGFTGNVSKGSSNENGDSATNVGSVINASGTVSLNSGKDTTITGSQVKGGSVIADVGGNLNIASAQDIDNYTSKSQNSSFGGTTGHAGGVTGSFNKGKADSNYASVTEQAGIYAGKGGFDVQVGKNTDLKGAVIASTATPDKNKLSTDTLTYSDIQNKADYSASSVGVNVNTSKDAKYNEKGVTPDIGVPASGDASSATKSAIANGTITIRSNPKQDISNLSRDTNGSLNALGKIFDKAKVQEKQELSNLFGELAYEEVHKFSNRAKDAAQNEYDDAKKHGATDDQLKALQAKIDSWNEGGSNKIALHALVGGVMSDLGGSGFVSGAVGAGINETVQGELKKRFANQPDMWQWGSALIGAAASKAVGGQAQAGASTAASGTKNNGQLEEALIPVGIVSIILANGTKVTMDASKKLVDGVWYLCSKAGELIAPWSEASTGNSESTTPTYTPSESTYQPDYKTLLGDTSFSYTTNEGNSVSNNQTETYQDTDDSIARQKAIDDAFAETYAQIEELYKQSLAEGEKNREWREYGEKLSWEARKKWEKEDWDKAMATHRIVPFTLDINKNGITGTTVATPNGPVALTNDKTQDSSITLIPNPNNNASNNPSPPPTAQTDDNKDKGGTSTAGTSDTSVVNIGTVTASTGEPNNDGSSKSQTSVNNDGEMLGKNGTKVINDTKWQNGKTERVDVENPNPGKRPGDVHYHDANNIKYRFDPRTGKLFDEAGNLAPNKVQKMMENKDVQRAINKGLEILGEKKYF
ncbi:MAG: hemagglutinin repeat-containing protein [Pelosinus sp.]|nr:hemagglutinin repeat-containing protein [Pelosinus sp.]